MQNRSSILYELMAKVIEKENKGEKIIKMNIGEPIEPPSQEIIENIDNALRKGFTKYDHPQGNILLRKKIGEFHNVDYNDVIITPGAKFGIYAVLKSHISTYVGVISPYWPAYALMLDDLNKKLINIPLSYEEGWQLSTWKNAELYIINSPHNPTGTIINVPKNIGKNVLYDLTYRNLCFDKPYDVKEGIRVYSFSKDLRIAGLRLGYIITSDPLLKNKIVSFLKTTITSVPSAVQIGIAYSYDIWEKEMKKTRDIYKKKYERFKKCIKIPHIPPQGGFYVFLNVKDGLKFAEKCLERGVAVVPGVAFGDYKEFVRVSLTVEEIEEACEKLNDVYEEINS